MKYVERKFKNVHKQQLRGKKAPSRISEKEPNMDVKLDILGAFEH